MSAADYNRTILLLLSRQVREPFRQAQKYEEVTTYLQPHLATVTLDCALGLLFPSRRPLLPALSPEGTVLLGALKILTTPHTTETQPNNTAS